MAIDLMSAIWKTAPYTGTRLLILLALADAASQEGYCWPSARTLAQRGRCNERNARVHIQALAHDGWITKLERSGQSNLYRVFEAPQQGQGTPVGSDTPPLSVATGRTISEPSKNHQEPSCANEQKTPALISAPPERRPQGSVLDVSVIKRDPLTQSLAACFGRTPITRREWGQWRIVVNELHSIGASPDDIPRAIRGFQITYPNARVTPFALVKHWSEIQGGTPHELAQHEITRRAAEVEERERHERERAERERRAREAAEVERYMREHGLGARA